MQKRTPQKVAIVSGAILTLMVGFLPNLILLRAIFTFWAGSVPLIPWWYWAVMAAAGVAFVTSITIHARR